MATTLSASERVLHARYQHRSPDWASEREARAFIENASTVSEHSAERSTIRVGEPIEAELSRLKGN